MKCNFKEDIDKGIFNKEENVCTLKSMGEGVRKCDGEEKCILMEAIRLSTGLNMLMKKI